MLDLSSVPTYNLIINRLNGCKEFFGIGPSTFNCPGMICEVYLILASQCGYVTKCHVQSCNVHVGRPGTCTLFYRCSICKVLGHASSACPAALLCVFCGFLGQLGHQCSDYSARLFWRAKSSHSRDTPYIFPVQVKYSIHAKNTINPSVHGAIMHGKFGRWNRRSRGPRTWQLTIALGLLPFC